MSDFISKVGKMAALRNLVVLLINQTATRVKTETGAVLLSAMSSTGWDGGVSSRLLLFRNWAAPQGAENIQESHGVRYISVLKAGGTTSRMLDAIPFVIERVR